MSERVVTPIRAVERTPQPPELPSVDAVAALAPAQLPSFVTQLGALLAAAGARLAASRDAPVPGDSLLTIEEAAKQLRTTLDWLRRHSHELPFTVHVSPGQVRYSTRGLERWIAARAGKGPA